MPVGIRGVEHIGRGESGPQLDIAGGGDVQLEVIGWVTSALRSRAPRNISGLEFREPRIDRDPLGFI